MDESTMLRRYANRHGVFNDVMILNGLSRKTWIDGHPLTVQSHNSNSTFQIQEIPEYYRINGLCSLYHKMQKIYIDCFIFQIYINTHHSQDLSISCHISLMHIFFAFSFQEVSYLLFLHESVIAEHFYKLIRSYTKENSIRRSVTKRNTY